MNSRLLLLYTAATLGAMSWNASAAPMTLISGVLNTEYEYFNFEFGEWRTEGQRLDLGPADYGYHKASYLYAGTVEADIEQYQIKMDGRNAGTSRSSTSRFYGEITFALAETSTWDITYSGHVNEGWGYGYFKLKDSTGAELVSSGNCFSFYDLPAMSETCGTRSGGRHQSVLLAPGLYTAMLTWRGEGGMGGGARGEGHFLMTSAVPLPAAAPLLGMGLLGLAGIGARRKLT